ncbi:hypothetical protein ACFXEL_37925 [Streptomyces sp. NPDC059382]|uniref:hypothetical protein n=1 Tax=Streptomyces sp. NPDC059382 TaxID=3346816 RepID=UPI0036C559BD
MHIPGYAHATIRAALPAMPTARQVGCLDCCLCDEPFDGRMPVPLGPTETSGLFACRPCLTRFVARARRLRDGALAQDAEQARVEAAEWAAVREPHLAGLESVRGAAEAVTRLASEAVLQPLKVAWLLVALESAHTWATDAAPKPPASADPADTELQDADFRLSLEMISAREAVADRLAYHLINESMPAEPEMCEEFECPEGCSGRHDTSEIDCGPDEVFNSLAREGVVLERPDGALPHRWRRAPGSSAASDSVSADMSEKFAEVLRHFGIDVNDAEVLVSAAAVGLVNDAWRDGPLDVIHSADGGPSDGEIFAQSVDLYRRAREAFITARTDGAEALLAFQAVASDVHLPWAGGSRFTLRASGEPTHAFVRHVDNRVWYTSKLMREQGWRVGVLHRAASAAFVASGHFGMPGWSGVVTSVMERIAVLDRSDAPAALADLDAVEAALREAPDRLGADSLDWLAGRLQFG